MSDGGPVLIARCANEPWEMDEVQTLRCPGRLRFRWGQSAVACDTCGAYCGVAVADWIAVER